MDIDEREALRQEMLKDQYHEKMMRNDTDYFCEHTVNTLMINTDKKQYIQLDTILYRLNRECKHYDQELGDLLDYMKEF